MELIAFKDKTYRQITAGPWTGVEELRLEERTPTNRWAGGKIPLALWREVLSFLEWSQEATKSETVVNLFYHYDTHRWAAMVLPQKGFNGMTITLLPDHPQTVPTFQRLGDGWEQFGTVHHHCRASAFQSGTDSADERTKEGLHITIGDLESARYSIHARTSFRTHMHQAVLSDWFDVVPQEVLAVLPEHLWDHAITHCLTTPVHGEFPSWWKENVVRVEATRPQLADTRPSYKPLKQSPYARLEQAPSVWNVPLEQEPAEDTRGEYLVELEEQFRMYGIGYQAMADALKDLAGAQEDILYVLIHHRVPVEEAIEALEEMAELEERAASDQEERDFMEGLQ
jgi:hypothetical protein